jgi:hypothetical protein
MPDQIVPIADIRRNAAQAFAGRTQPARCPYPDGSAASEVWLHEYRELYADWSKTQQRAAA